jgi:hypothetical protein
MSAVKKTSPLKFGKGEVGKIMTELASRATGTKVEQKKDFTLNRCRLFILYVLTATTEIQTLNTLQRVLKITREELEDI